MHTGEDVTVRVWVELSGENVALAEAELDALVERLGGERGASDPRVPPAWRPRIVPDLRSAAELARRLALARRVAVPWDDRSLRELAVRLEAEGASGGTAAFRSIGSTRRPALDPPGRALADAFVRGGGRIDLERPDRRFRVGEDAQGNPLVAEEIGSIDRRAYTARRMPALPFQRPVSLPPRLGRAAVNLARIGPGERVVDPFVGTGALLIEAALIGARVSGVDRDPVMVQGALRNFAFAGVEAQSLTVADAAAAFAPAEGGLWDAVVTDPPYGRASTTGGESPEALVSRVLPRWAELVRPDGRVVVVVPGGPAPLAAPWELELAVRDRVHRSLTREFRVYRRRGAGGVS